MQATGRHDLHTLVILMHTHSNTKVCKSCRLLAAIVAVQSMSLVHGKQQVIFPPKLSHCNRPTKNKNAISFDCAIASQKIFYYSQRLLERTVSNIYFLYQNISSHFLRSQGFSTIKYLYPCIIVIYISFIQFGIMYVYSWKVLHNFLPKNC